MKFCRTPVSKSRGFTLIELLVVVVIIAILAAIVLGGGTTVLNASKRTKTLALANQIQAAVTAYDTEYSAYPVPSGVTVDYALLDDDTAKTAAANSWGSLIECLCGMISPSTGTNVSATETIFSNTRQIQFLTLRTSDVSNVTGSHLDAPLNSLPPNATQLYLNIAVDADYDGLIGGTDTTSGTWLPNFTTVNTTTAPATGGSCTTGVAIWANCVGSSTKYNSNQWVKTY
jgi:prepilin-type N-terminal cleavage/methylation domain-containing protein